MHLVRFEVAGDSKVGRLADGTITELVVERDSERVPGVVAVTTTGDVEESTSTFDVSEVTLTAPVPRPGKIVCVGLNYSDHAAEGGNEIPDAPLLFSKATSSVIGPDETIEYPSQVDQLDYEGELAIVVGREGRHIDSSDARDHIAGYTILNDVSARDVQYEFSQYFRGKSFDTFAPMGPALVTPDEVTESELSVRTLVNGDVRQDSSTSHMIFPVEDVVESVSSTMTLYPGDVIATGTPPGVGVHQTPPRLLETGDEISVEIEGLGTLTNTVREES